MSIRKTLAILLAVALVTVAMPFQVVAQSQGRISGTAKNEAKKPYADFTVRARAAGAPAVAATTDLDATAGFSLQDLGPGKYVVELVNVKKNKIVCTEGPFELTAAAPSKTGVVIKCGREPLTYLVLAAAGAAGLAAGLAVGGTASGSK